MAMRQKLARCLRKWADLIDPRIGPRSSTELHMTLTCDTTDFDLAVSRSTHQLAMLQDVLAKLQPKR